MSQKHPLPLPPLLDRGGKVRAEVETAMKLPFHTDQDSVTIAAGGSATLSLLLLPFTPGEYK